MSRTLIAFILAAFASIASADVVANFDPGSHTTLDPKSVTARIGDGFLHIEPATEQAGQAYVQFTLPADVSAAKRDRLSARFRAAPTTSPTTSSPTSSPAQPSTQPAIDLTWLALDAKSKPIFIRRFKLERGQQWVKLDAPLRTFRWSEQRIGDWDEVRSLAIRIDSPGVKQLDLDDISIDGTASDSARADWLIDLAFGGQHPRKTASGDGFTVWTDAVDAFADADLRRLTDDASAARKFIRRVFGEAVRPTDDISSPPVLIIFARDEDRAAFFDRLGEAWSATIAPPRAQGYTVHDIATATYDPKLGVRRPVYLHESVHAIVARDLRLNVGSAAHKPLQEGIANYIQLCVHPQSIERNAYPKAFAAGVDESGDNAAGGGLFKPLESLFTSPITTRQYAQLASLVAYLVENDQPLLRDLAKGLADGQSAADVLKNHEIDWPKLEAAWLKWGRDRFQTAPPQGRSPFDVPAEFR